MLRPIQTALCPSIFISKSDIQHLYTDLYTSCTPFYASRYGTKRYETAREASFEQCRQGRSGAKYISKSQKTKPANRCAAIDTEKRPPVWKVAFDWRCHPDLNWGWSFCRALPYHLAMAPHGAVFRPKKMERVTRLELATSTLARWRSTR